MPKEVFMALLRQRSWVACEHLWTRVRDPLSLIMTAEASNVIRIHLNRHAIVCMLEQAVISSLGSQATGAQANGKSYFLVVGDSISDSEHTWQLLMALARFFM